MTSQNPFLLAGAVLSALASLAHIGVIFGGPSWYRFFGAGERMARAAEARRWYPTLVTIAIAAVLAGFSAYALAGAHLIEQLPLTRPILLIITLIYLGRGLVILPVAVFAPRHATRFLVWSSLICLVYGTAYLAGLVSAWSSL
jgi:hypothetical protein